MAIGMTDSTMGVGGPEEEPQALCCPITHVMFRDPVFVCESGNTYEREAIEAFWARSTGGVRDALTNKPLSSQQVFTNWDRRREVAAWLSAHPTRVPTGWSGRDDIPPPTSQPAAPAHGGGFFRWSVRSVFIVVIITLAVCAGFDMHKLLPSERSVRDAVNTEKPGLKERVLAAPTRAHTCAASEMQTRASVTKAVDQLLRGGRLQIDMDGPLMTAVLPRSQVLELQVRQSPAARPTPPTPSPLPPLPASPTLGQVGELAMALFVLAFTAVWTSGACTAGAPLPFVCFSAPFWSIGAWMLKSALQVGGGRRGPHRTTARAIAAWPPRDHPLVTARAAAA